MPDTIMMDRWTSSYSLRVSYQLLWHSAILLLSVLWTVTGQGGQVVQYQVKEEVPADTLVGNIATSFDITTQEITEKGLQFDFLSDTAPNLDYFHLDAGTGELRTVGRLDRESICAFEDSCDVTLDVTVQEPGSFQIVKVIVKVEDINDNSPYFPEDRHVLYVSETANADTAYALVNAEDRDAGNNGIVRYELLNHQDKFGLKVSGDVHLVVKQELDREQQEFYSLQLVAYDGGDQSATMSVEVSVLDTNDNAPEFEQQEYEVYVFENIDVDTVILQIHATDPDDGANGEVVYEFSRKTQAQFGNVFELNSFSGELSTKVDLNYAENSQYELGVVAKDQGPSSLAGYAKVIVGVRDLNDHAPEIVVNARGGPKATVAENADPGAFVAHVSVTDPDGGENGKFHCQLDDPNFELTQTYETEFKILSVVSFDRESRPEYTVNILCEDLGSPQQVSREPLEVEIVDVNDHAPVFTQPLYERSIEENNALNTRILQVQATDADIGRNGQIRYRIEGRGFPNTLLNMEPETGIITTRGRLDHEERSQWEFNIIATDQGDPSLSATASLILTVEDVNDEAPRFPQSTFTFTLMENQPGGSVLGDVVAYDPDSAPFNIITYSLDAIGSKHFSIDENLGTLMTTRPLDREEKGLYTFTVEASNKQDSLKSFTQVQVLVQDDNDHAPVIDFPNDDVVQISANAQAGETVMYVRAHDDDTGENAQIRYYILSSSVPDLFTINVLNGALTLKYNVYDYKDQIVAMAVQAKDRGKPPLSSVEEMQIFINGTATPSGDSAPLLVTDTSFVIIILLTVTALVSICLIITIVFLLRRRRIQRRKEQGIGYSNQIDAADVEGGFDESQKKELYPALNTVNGQMQNGKLNNMAYEAQNCANANRAPPGGSKHVTFGEMPGGAGAEYCEKARVGAADYGPPMLHPEYREEARHRLLYGNLQHPQMQLNEMPRPPASDQDSDRGSSDSGRGASEEEANNSHDSLPASRQPNLPPAGGAQNRPRNPHRHPPRRPQEPRRADRADSSSFNVRNLDSTRSDSRNIGAYNCRRNSREEPAPPPLPKRTVPPSQPQGGCRTHGGRAPAARPPPPNPPRLCEHNVVDHLPELCSGGRNQEREETFTVDTHISGDVFV